MELSRDFVEGEAIVLEPVSVDHLPEINEAAADPSIWKWMTFKLSDPVVAEKFVENVAQFPDSGHGVCYVIRCRKSGMLVGGTGYWHIDQKHRKLEIGGSWLTPSRQRTGVNTESKYLLLTKAFEELDVGRVGFSIDTRNTKSIDAITRIGAVPEGIARNDLILHDGRERDSAIFSILKQEWPDKKAVIKGLLSKYR